MFTQHCSSVARGGGGGGGWRIEFSAILQASQDGTVALT